MATILNIETSGKICSVALTRDGVLEYNVDEREGMKHAERLAPFVEKALAELKRKEWTLDAVAVSIGPGSYTGLRIGLSLAKGLAYSLSVPLIGVNTLKILAVKAMFGNHTFTGDELLVPMIDARRMEVFTGVYDFSLKSLQPDSALILDEDSYAEYLKNKQVWFIGDGVEKAKKVLSSVNAHWIDGLLPQAKDMLALSEKAFRERDFIDVAYSEPYYIKEYQTTTPKKSL